MAEKKSLSLGAILVGVAVLAALWVGGSYNGLVNADENVTKAYANIDTQLQRRYDLIPNLQNIVEGAADFERSTFIAVTEARTKWLSAGTPNAKVQAAQETEAALARLLLMFENYPQLKATAAFQDFMVQLEGTENRISVARKDYNEAATVYNKKIRVVPGMLVAKILGFDRREVFEAITEAENAPAVEFDFDS